MRKCNKCGGKPTGAYIVEYLTTGGEKVICEPCIERRNQENLPKTIRVNGVKFIIADLDGEKIYVQDVNIIKK